MENLLTLNNLRGGYHKQEIIRGISLEISKGDFLGIIGPNGSGKTTLLRLMSRALKPQAGKILLKGEDISFLDLKQFCCQVAFVSQDALINFSFSVFEIVLMGRIPHLKRLQTETKNDLRIAELALIMTDTVHLKDKMINELSSGERQRVLIARALAQEPVLLFLDEPTAHLDIGHQVQILDLLRRLNRNENLTIIMVLHDLNLAGEYCNRVVLLDNGQVFQEGVPEQVLTYQNIEKVYKTVVVVNKNPINSKPYVLLVSGEK
ncbi:MAG: ABC transporter ATP-binding protein [Candidatus Omnitrophota bacterium]